MAIAYRIIGELENQELLGLRGELYPLGQNIRGALGYAFLDMGLKEIANTYIQQVNPVLYFRDCICKCKCKSGVDNSKVLSGDLLPLVRQDVVGGMVIKEIIYKCNKCGVINRNPVSRDKIMGTHISETGTANTFVDDIISNVERTKFKFEIILKGLKDKESKDKESYLAELMAAIKFIEENGLYIGKRKNKGLGKMSLKHVKMSEIGMKEISQRGEEIEKKVKKDNGVVTIKLVSDTIGKSPITGEDLLRDIKNAIKFFHPHWHEIRDEYRDPKMNLIGKNIELGERKTVYFLDCKVDKDSSGMKIENMKLDKSDNVISKGTQYSYQLYDMDKISSEFWNGLAMAEMLRGVGDRTSFGKGQFIVS